MVRELIDESRPWPRYETVYGELLVSPAPRLWHQEVVARLLVALREYCARVGGMHAFVSPADISWSEDTLVQPDVFVVPIDEARSLDWRLVKTLLLAAEVLSASSLRADRFTKRRLYQDRDVSLYWVIDADAHAAEVWTPRTTFPTIETEALEWFPEGASAPFLISLAELLRPL
jgi:Uma2 family endonuclease